VNDRGRWVWNDAGQSQLEELARAHPNDLRHWQSPSDIFEPEVKPLRDAETPKYLWSEFQNRTDPMCETRPQIAAGVSFQPYPLHPQDSPRKNWALVAHAARGETLEPIRQESRLLGIQLGLLVLAMVMLAGGLARWMLQAARNE
jgi:hypothetical protein